MLRRKTCITCLCKNGVLCPYNLETTRTFNILNFILIRKSEILAWLRYKIFTFNESGIRLK